jgi:hypothetical protein
MADERRPDLLDQRGQLLAVDDALLVQHGALIQAGRGTRREVIHHRDLVAPLQERIGQVRADEAGAAGH